MDGQYVDERVSNMAPVDQSKPQAPVTGRPEAASPGANAPQFQPWNGPNVVGDLNVSPRAGDQTTVVKGSGDLAAGEYEPAVGTRTPAIKGLS